MEIILSISSSWPFLWRRAIVEVGAVENMTVYICLLLDVYFCGACLSCCSGWALPLIPSHEVIDVCSHIFSAHSEFNYLMPLKRSQSAVLVYRKELDTPALLPVARTRWQCSYLGHFIAISVQWEKVEMVYLSSDRYEIQNVLNVFFFLFFFFFIYLF